MFKSILPSRRIASTDFQMLTSPIDPSETEHNGKENYFANSNILNDSNVKPKTEKRKKSKGRLQAEQEMPTEDFDRLLVSLRFASCIAYLRMLYRWSTSMDIYTFNSCCCHKLRSSRDILGAEDFKSSTRVAHRMLVNSI